MTVGPVSWAEYPGEYLERVMAVLISQEHRKVIRRTPSSGDGGVDILVPVDGGWHVRQVKGFTGRMTASRRRKVEKSLADLLADPRLTEPVLAWRLTVPIDPTSQEQGWFEELVKGVDFDTGWEGRVFWDAMSAKHPHVIDYYFRDGRARVEEKFAALLAASDAAAAGTISSADVEGNLERLRIALNRDDPHYRYEFVTGSAMLDPKDLPQGVIVAKSQSMSDGGILTTLVFERYEGALQDAPIRGELEIAVHDSGRHIDIRDAFEGFRTYGRALELPEGALGGVIEAPGDFGGALDGAVARIGPMSVHGAPSRSRLALIHPAEGAAHELTLVTESVTRGELGGAEVHTVDERGVLRARFTIGPPSVDGAVSGSFNVSIEALYGKPVLDCLPAARLADHLEPPYELRWLEEFGTRVLAVRRFADKMEVFPSFLLPFLEDLATLQENVRGTVVVPSSIDGDMIYEMREVGLLLRNGEVRGTWSSHILPLSEDANEEDLRGMFAQEGSLVVSGEEVVQLEDRLYDIGVVTEVVASARIADEQPIERAIQLEPGRDNTVIKRLGPPTS